MKHTVKNMINSPYDVITVDGPQRIPARGELTAEFDERSLAIMRQMGYFQISEAGDIPPVPLPVYERPDKIPAVDLPPMPRGDDIPAVALPDSRPKRGPGRPKKDA